MAIRTGKPVAQVVPPALPKPDFEYSMTSQDRFLNILRLYFNGLNNALNSLLAVRDGGASLFKPHASAYGTATQTAGATNTAQIMQFNTLSPNNTQSGIAVAGVNGINILVDYAGVYTINVSAQLFSTTVATKRITVWLRKNGIDVPFSAQTKTIVKNGYEQLLFITNIELQASDVVNLVWAVTDTGLRLESSAASAPYPAIPSATLDVVHVSNAQLGV
jgi:hypothetical protein